MPFFLILRNNKNNYLKIMKTVFKNFNGKSLYRNWLIILYPRLYNKTL